MADGPLTGSLLRVVRGRRVSGGSKLFLALVLVLLPVFVSDNAGAFRIRDGTNLASMEQTGSSCNPLLDRCSERESLTSAGIGGKPGSGARSRLHGGLSSIRGMATRSGSQPPVERVTDEEPETLVSEVVGGHESLENARVRFKVGVTRTKARKMEERDGKLKASMLRSEEEDDDEDARIEDEEDYESNDEREDDEEGEETEDDEIDEDDEESEELEDIAAESDDDEDGLGTDEDRMKDQSVEGDDEDEEEEGNNNDMLENETKSIEDSKEGPSKMQETDVEESTVGVTDQLDRKQVGHGVDKTQSKTIDSKTSERSVLDESVAEIGGTDANGSSGADNDDDSVIVVTLPSRKLDRVRHADRVVSLEMTRSKTEGIRYSNPVEAADKSVPDQPKKTEPPKPPAVIVEKAPQKAATKLSGSMVNEPSQKSSPKVSSSGEGIKSPQKAPPKRDEKSVVPTTKGDPKKAVGKEAKGAPKPMTETKSEAKEPSQKEAERSERPKSIAKEAKNDTPSAKSKSKSTKQAEASISLQELNDLLLQVPTFTPNFTAIKSPACQKHGKIFLRQLRGYKLWAMQMLDSSAKIPSGILRGNINQLGDFDQCLSVKAHVKVEASTVKVQGKYCLATIDLHATRTDTKVPVNLMQSRAFIRANIHEPGHFVPRFTSVNWAVCVPAACTSEDVESVVENVLQVYNQTTGLRFSVNVDPESCYVKQKPQPYSKETIAVLYFYAMTVCLVAVATLRDFWVKSVKEGNYSERIIMAFSLRRTTKMLLQDTQDAGEIRCIHGIRTLATIFLYIAHKLIPVSRIPYANRIALTEMSNNPLTSVLRTSIVYTDSFLLLSGVLTSYNMAKEYKQRGEIRWFCRFVTRVVRLTPALLAVVFWYAFVMEHVGSGPQWNTVVKSNADLCKKNAWTNLLYVQNFFPFEEMCATHTHQLALDMQLSLIAPMLVFFLYCKPIIGILVVFFLLQVSATLRYLATSNNNLSVVIYHGMSLKNLYKTANLTYVLPLHRATPYVFGVVLGALIRYTGKEIRISKWLVALGWITAAFLGSWSLFSPWNLARRDYTYNVEEATYYAVVLPVSWAMFLCWVIFASFTNNGGAINKFLSSFWMVIFSRVSYAVYLTQFAVFFYNVGTTRYGSEFQIHRALDLYEGVVVIVASVVLTLLLDLPMQEVKSVLMECTNVVVSSDKAGDAINDAEERKKIEGHATGGGIANGKREFMEEPVQSIGWNRDRLVGSGDKVPLRSYPSDEDTSEPQSYRRDEDRFRPVPRREMEDWLASSRRSVRRDLDEVEDLRRDRRSHSRPKVTSSEYSDDPRGSSRRTPGYKMHDEEVVRRDRRSQSRVNETKRSSNRDLVELDYRRFDPMDRLSPRRGVPRDPRSVNSLDNGTRDYFRKERSMPREENHFRNSYVRGSSEQPSRDRFKAERAALQGIDNRRTLAPRGIDGQASSLRFSTGSLSRLSDFDKRVLSPESEGSSSWRDKPIAISVSPPEEPGTAPDEVWESDVRPRPPVLSQSEPSEELFTGSEEEEWNVLRRRSSAEGKMALLNDTPEMQLVAAWGGSTPRSDPMGGYSREVSGSEEENSYPVPRDDYRETQPPFRETIEPPSEEEEPSWNPSSRRSYASDVQSTSFDEEEPSVSFDYILKKSSKRISLQNLSKLPTEQEQPEAEAESESGWDFVKEEPSESGQPRPLPAATTGLFKRASIVKSQASEEDPEFLLPERPKLVEQEQEHPFKKAWQMQKSRSEEDGPAVYLVKEVKPRSEETVKEHDETSQVEEVPERRTTTGGQNEDLSYFAGDEAETGTFSHEASTSGESAELDWVEEEENGSEISISEHTDDRSNAKSELSGDSKADDGTSPTELEPIRRSDDSNWEWDQEET